MEVVFQPKGPGEKVKYHMEAPSVLLNKCLEGSGIYSTFMIIMIKSALSFIMLESYIILFVFRVLYSCSDTGIIQHFFINVFLFPSISHN